MMPAPVDLVDARPWYAAGSRADLLTPRLAADMAAGGCREMFLGVESGNDRVLTELGKGSDRETMRQAIELAASSCRSDR